MSDLLGVFVIHSTTTFDMTRAWILRIFVTEQEVLLNVSIE